MRRQRPSTKPINEFVLEQLCEFRNANIKSLTAAMKIDAQQFKFGLRVTGTNTNERTTVAEVIESCELLCCHSRAAIRQDIYMGEQTDFGCHACDPAKCGNRVGPVRAHSTNNCFGKRHMVAYPDIGVSIVVASPSQATQLFGPSSTFPVGHEIGTLGLDGQLHSIYTASLRNREHPPSHSYTLGVGHIFSDGVSESICPLHHRRLRS